MEAKFSSSYIERLFRERDFDSLHQVISVVEAERPLPEEFWLFCRLFEWAPSRSGVWQYYEGTPAETVNRVLASLNQFQLTAIAAKYAAGANSGSATQSLDTLDDWLEANAAVVHSAAFQFIEKHQLLLAGGA